MAETLTDVHRAIIGLVDAGQPLMTKKVHRAVTAKIGPERIDARFVSDLEAAGLIRCREVHDKGPLNGKFCWYELTGAGRRALSDSKA